MKALYIGTTMLLLGLLSAPGWAQMGMMQGGGMGMAMGMGMGSGSAAGMGGGAGSPRHRLVMQQGIPAAYAEKRNPLQATADNLAAGRHIYQQDCAMCHGTSGRGDGPAGKALNPPPADLAWTVRMPIASDPFLYWTIAEGGAPVGSAMPAYKGMLKEDDAWKLILYLRSL